MTTSGRRSVVLALVGLRCSGKTTVGRALAERTGADFVDLDQVVASRTGLRSAGEVIEACGLERFRDLEEQALNDVLASAARPLVLSTGGGVVVRAASRERLGQGATVAWLRAPLALLRQRMAADHGTSRPRITAGDEDEFISLERERAPLLEALADEVVEVEGRDTRELAAHLDGLWRG